MKKIYYSFVLFLVLLLLFDTKAYAKEVNTGLITEQLSEERMDYVLSNLNELKMLNQMPEGMQIECFDVSEQGLIAIGSAGASSTKYIGIYDGSGVYQYGYICNTEGSYVVEWDGDNLLIYLGRSGLLISVNTEGKIENILEAEYNSHNSYYIRNVLMATKKVQGDVEYKICNEGILSFVDVSPYSQLVAVNADGHETIIYNANYNPVPYMIIGACFVLFMFSCLILTIKVRKSTDSSAQFS